MKKFRPRTEARLAIAVLAIAAASAGCGYSTTSRTAKDIKSVHVPFFENKTAEPNLEITVTERIIDNLVSDNTLKVVSADEADAILDGTISEFRNKPFSFNPDLNAEEYIVVIKVVVSLFNRRTNEPIWQNRQFEGNGSYFVEQTEQGRTFDDAVAESISEITNQILNVTVQDW
ncbi:MAG TPA: LptE family protein [Candidatus Krumholzibacteria bacterium]|nr:LptE family protein [Candidatus Krumholzibacteria bacterium]